MVKKKETIPTEHHEQTVFVTWVRKQGYKIVAIPNGGSRNLLEGVRLKASGVSAGFPDLFVPLPHPPYHGFFIEMKRQKGGKTSDAQLEWLDYLRAYGYFADVANGAEEAKKMFIKYLSL